MTHNAFGGAHAGEQGLGSGVYHYVAGLAAPGASIVAAPGAFPGAFAYQIDPVNGHAGLEIYGFTGALPDTPTLISVPFMFRFTAAGALTGFDEPVIIAELGSNVPGGVWSRHITITTGVNSEQIQITDKDDDRVGITAPAYVTKNTDYWFLWYTDLRDEANTRDILWVWKAGAWDKAIDETGHGDANPEVITRLTFGTSTGKGLPTEGGPFWVAEMVGQVLNKSPNQTPLGSIETHFKKPDGVGEDSNQFDGGAPDWQDVDEIPPDDVATDIGDAAGEAQSYDIEAADGGDVPLAVQIIGSSKQSGGVGGAPHLDIDHRPYIWDETTRGYSPQSNTVPLSYRLFGWGGTVTPITYNEINGETLTEALFNKLEAGIEVDVADNGATLVLDQIGLEYMIDGPKALPDDYPMTTPTTAIITPGPSGVIQGSANPGIF